MEVLIYATSNSSILNPSNESLDERSRVGTKPASDQVKTPHNPKVFLRLKGLARFEQCKHPTSAFYLPRYKRDTEVPYNLTGRSWKWTS